MPQDDKAKRRLILDTAARLFASKRFDEVKLDAIASRARLGKGTIYLYFKSKDDLYAALIIDALERLFRDLCDVSTRQRSDPWDELERAVEVLLGFAHGNPHLFTLIRAGIGKSDPRVEEIRARIASHCEGIIRRGVRTGAITDPHPELTTQYLLSFVRVTLLYAPAGLPLPTLRGHILRVLGRGIRERPGERKPPRRNPRRSGRTSTGNEE